MSAWKARTEFSKEAEAVQGPTTKLMTLGQVHLERTKLWLEEKKVAYNKMLPTLKKISEKRTAKKYRKNIGKLSWYRKSKVNTQTRVHQPTHAC